MKKKKLLTKIKTLPKFIKKHPHVSPQSVMARLSKYTKMAAYEYYGQGLESAMRYHDYMENIHGVGKIKISSVIMDRHFANLVMSPKGKNIVRNNVPKSDDYFVQMIVRSIQKALYRKIRMDDVLEAQKRVLKTVKLIKSKDDYDTNGTLEAERDLNSEGMRTTPMDISIIAFSCAHAAQNDKNSKEKRVLVDIFNVFYDKITSNPSRHFTFGKEKIRLILTAMKREKKLLLSQMAAEDLKNWYRLYKKLKIYEKRIQRDESIHNPLLREAIRLMKDGKVRSSLDTLLTNMEIDHAACQSHCYDQLSDVTVNIIMDTDCAGPDTQLAILDDMITGSKQAAEEDPIQARDAKIMRKFARHGYHYAALTFKPDGETLKTIKPISWNAGMIIMNDVVSKFRHYVEE